MSDQFTLSRKQVDILHLCRERTGISTYYCNQCEHETYKNAHLKEHIKIHSDGEHIAVNNVNVKATMI